MSVSSLKLSPTELLAELKDQATSPTSNEKEIGGAIDVFDLDFSDLEDLSEAEEQQKDVETNNEADEPVRDGSDDVKPADLAPADEMEPAKPEPASTPDAVKKNSQLSELFDRVNSFLDSSPADSGESYHPREPQTLEETGLIFDDVERLVLKFLLSKGSALGREICGQIRLPYLIVEPILKELKQDQLLVFKGTAEMGDYNFAITDYGRERARRYSEECSYFGAAPVSLADYLEAMAAQSVANQHVTEDDLRSAFSDLILNQSMFDKLGPAINSGRGMFLFGEPGNGKTSIAERITRTFGTTIWIPRTLGIDGDIIRIFDPGVHTVIETEAGEGLFKQAGIDERWVQIERPTIIAGGELTMRELEVVQNKQTKICEAPLQLKSNCGTLVIDDFGRQTMPVDVLLNRWIVPLEKRYDFLNLPSGKKVQVPFDQLIIFSTNLEPKDLVDDAFLRRIPYKIEVLDPTESEFRELMKLMSPLTGFEYEAQAVDYLITKHYREAKRPFRACQPRDLLLQVKNFCTYKQLPKKMTEEAFDFAVDNYFSVM